MKGTYLTHIKEEIDNLTHLCRPVRSTFAVRETASLGIMGAPEVPPLYRETQSLGQQMLNAPVGINGLMPNAAYGLPQVSTWQYIILL